MRHTVETLLSHVSSRTSEGDDLIKRAYQFAKHHHQDQLRLSGEPYFNHVFETALILSQIGLDPTTISAGLLHDIIEDTEATQEDIKKEFGSEILFLVEGVTKLGKIKYRGVERHVESLRKLFIATSQDIRVLIIKLCDRVHNMRTLEFIPEEKQKRIALETLEVHAPIAHRLGIGSIKDELEGLSFKYLYPQEYQETQKVAESRYIKAEQELKKLHKKLLTELAHEMIRVIRTEYRRKHIWSLYKKLLRKEMDIEKIYDIMALRIVVPTVSDCYRALGIVHSLWRPLPGRIKDFIAFPKPNGYQSLHTTIFTGEGSIAEVQIRTKEMHDHAEYGVASHVRYKHGNSDSSTLGWIKKLIPSGWSKHSSDEIEYIETKPPLWIEELVEAQEELEKPKDYLNGVKSDFLIDRIFVFTPKGDVIDLPIESSPVDFAYYVHSDIGDHIQGAKVNGKLVSLSTKLKNGDIVEIMTSAKSHPSKKWLEYSKTLLAKRSIKQYLKESSTS